MHSHAPVHRPGSVLSSLSRNGVIALAVVLATISNAHATVLPLNASSDNTMYSEDGAASNGAGDYVFTGTTQDGYARRTLMRFDVSSIPAGSTINSVSLRLYCSRGKSNTAYATTLHRLLADWGEGTSDALNEEGQGAPAATNDATWTHRFYPGTLWTTPGGDYSVTPSASTDVGADPAYYTWASADMAADVQAWVDGAASNYGWLIKGVETLTRTSKRFDSRTIPTTSQRPVLTIDYTSGGDPTGACCLPEGCSELTAAQCASLGGAYQGDGTPCAPDPCAGTPITVPVGASKDNTLYESATGALSNGMGQRFITGKNTSNLKRRGVIAFDVASAIPAGATIQSVSLTLHLATGGGATGNANVALHRTLANWGEGTSIAPGDESAGAPSTTNDATWIHRFYPGTLWTAAGGDWFPTASASLMVTSEMFYTWSTTTMATDVQGWLNNPSSNFGWTVIGKENGGGSTMKPFYTKQSTDPSVRPLLSITYVYTPPLPTGACCFANGTCSELTEAGCLAASGTYRGDNTQCVADLCPVVLTPFVDPLPIPPLATPTTGTIGDVATYDIEIREVSQQLHRDLPPTRVWGYEGMYPGPTILASRDRPITVNWINDLRDSTGALRTAHYLPVDLCLHGPDMEGNTPRVVAHLHGGHVPAAVDGYPTSTMLPGEQQSYVYPNNQDAATLWYHDHALGITRLNVMMGLAGYYVLKDSVETALNLPSGEYDIGLAVQDRSFHADGTLMYPEMWHEHFFGDKVLVNGKVWPYLNVKQGKYRFRILEGSNSRVYRLSLSNGAPFTVIGTEGGLLEAPVQRNVLTITPGERVDVVIDFAPYGPGTEILLTNDAPAPFPGTPGEGVIPNVMKFIVNSGAGHTAPLPATLRPVVPLDPGTAVENRQFVLRKRSDPCAGSMWMINDLGFDDITEFPVLGTTETWTFVNPTGVVHPMHMHLEMFQVLDRTPIMMVGDSVVVTGPPVPPDMTEQGWKDTAPVYPNEALRVIAKFRDYVGRYPYHCHILEHEDNEMMRQFETVASPVDVMLPPRAYSFALEQTRPNPFVEQTVVSFELPREEHVTANVYDVRGRLVRELLNEQHPAGRHQLLWEGVGGDGRHVPAGIYFIRLESGEYRAVRKVTVLR